VKFSKEKGSERSRICCRGSSICGNARWWTAETWRRRGNRRVGAL